MICKDCIHFEVCGINNVLKTVNECPYKRTDKVKHGEWIKSNPLTDTFECSLCGMQIPVPEMCSPFCPLCGADMRKGETE